MKNWLIVCLCVVMLSACQTTNTSKGDTSQHVGDNRNDSAEGWSAKGENGSRSFPYRHEGERVVIFHDGASQKSLREVEALGNESVRQALDFYDMATKIKYGIFLFKSEADRNRVSEFELHGHNIYVWHPNAHTDYQTYDMYVAHELTHMVQMEILGGHWSEKKSWAWLNEGIATLIGYSHSSLGAKEYSLEHLKRRSFKMGEELQPLKEMVTWKNWYGYLKQGYGIVYSQSQSVIRYIIESYGRDKVLQLYQNARLHDWEKAFQKTFGLSAEKFEENWKRWLFAELGTAI